MNGEGSSENTLQFGGKRFGEEEEGGVENDGGNKRNKEMAIDRFDEFPDSLLIHILSFLNVKEAAITCVLSKRWEFLWTELPRLVFRADLSRVRGYTEYSEKVRNFACWINRTLAIRSRRRVKHLEEFGVCSDHHFWIDVDACILFAVENKVKKLNLHFDRCWRSNYYIVPRVMYSCPSLTTLHLQGCHMLDSERAIDWPSLTHLHLHNVDVGEHLLDNIFSSCAVLYGIYVEGCSGFIRLEATSPSLRSLSIVDSRYEYEPISLKISAPYIHSLYVSLFMEDQGRKLQLGNISSLVRADIDYKRYSGEPTSFEVMSYAKELLQSVRHVKELYVGLQFFEVVSIMVLNGWQLPQSRRELLVVNSVIEYKYSIPGIIGLLESSPNLETLVIEGCAIDWEDVVLKIAVEDVKDDLAGDLLHLKTIKFRNFVDSKVEWLQTLVRMLLKRATSLEEMVIVTDGRDFSDFEEIVQAMLTYPRSSTKAVIHLVK